VEIDPDTGVTTRRSTSPRSTTSARVINPMIVEGQVHGGVAQGIGQALHGKLRAYDRETGQLLTGSFMDYTMPRALTTFLISKSQRLHPLHPQPAGNQGLR
jgi:carbon-monoxide dehydrogenase large subunit